jgi:DUF438 domain-containing protein
MSISIQYKGAYLMAQSDELSAPYLFVSGQPVPLKAEGDLPYFKKNNVLFNILKKVNNKTFIQKDKTQNTGSGFTSATLKQNSPEPKAIAEKKAKPAPKPVEQKVVPKITQAKNKKNEAKQELPEVKKKAKELTASIKNKTTKK